MLESNVTAILGECLSWRVWPENHQRLPLPSASVGCRDFTIMPNIMVRSRLRENRMCVSGRTFDGVHMRSSLLCQRVRSGRGCEHLSNDYSVSGPGVRISVLLLLPELFVSIVSVDPTIWMCAPAVI